MLYTRLLPKLGVFLGFVPFCVPFACTDKSPGTTATSGVGGAGGAAAAGGTTALAGSAGAPVDGPDMPGASGVAVTSLVTETLTNPLGIDTMAPRLSWMIESETPNQVQTAYQIQATSGDAIVWDSGKVESSQQSHIPYGGPALTSRQHIDWQVRVWDAQGLSSPWSDTAFFEMGLLEETDWQAQWITRATELVTPSAPAPYLRHGFSVDKPVVSARAYVAGAGLFELHLNGEKVGDHVLSPGFTRFDRRLLYVTFDVTERIVTGENAVGLILGNGFLNVNAQDVWDFDSAPWRMTPRGLVQLEIQYEDGTRDVIASDATWTTSTGSIVFDGIRNGQADDARLEPEGWSTPNFDAATWSAAQVVPSPGGVLSAQMFPPQKVMQTLTAQSVTQPAPGTFIFDFGQNTAGWGKLSVSGPAGTEVTLRYAEQLNADGTIDQSSVSGVGGFPFYQGPVQTDRYILKGEGTEVWEPRFGYHGFQYIEVTGFPGTPTADNLEAQVVHTSFETIGQFESSNDLLNWIQNASQWSYTANFQSIPTDCPHREKIGWMGDAQLAAELGMFNFANSAGYTKWIRDVRDEMPQSGELPGIVPTGGWGYAQYNGPGWGSALLLIPWYMYLYTGDTQILTENYEHFKRYVDYIDSVDYIAENPEAWLPDWLPPTVETPAAVTHAGYHAVDARIIALTAQLLGDSAAAEKYSAMAERVKQDFLAAFFDEGTAQISNDSQTALSTALYQNLLDPEDRPRVLQRLVDNVMAHDRHLDTGSLGTQYLPFALTAGGRADLFFDIATQEDFPSWGRWRAEGATTLWERWEDAGSHNHVFLGSISAWFFRALAGINPDPEAPGFAHVIIRPEVVGDLTFARAETTTLRGLIQSGWEFVGQEWVLSVTIPVNSTATVYVPAASEGAVTAPGATFVASEGDRQIYTVGSGSWEFRVQQ